MVKLAYTELISLVWASSVDRKGVFVQSNRLSLTNNNHLTAVFNTDSLTSFNWHNRVQIPFISPHFQNSRLMIADGFADVRLIAVDQLMRQYRSISRRFSGENFLKYGDGRSSERMIFALSTY